MTQVSDDEWRRWWDQFVQKIATNHPDIKRIHDLHTAVFKQKPPRRLAPSTKQLRVDTDVLQRVLDHVKVGRVVRHEKLAQNVYRVWTPKAEYLIAVFPDRLSFDELDKLQHDLKESTKIDVGEIERVLLPDYAGKLRRESSYVHTRGHYFTIYQIEEGEEQAA